MAVSHFNRDLEFDDLNHEALMGVWWTGVLLKKQARRFFRDTLASEAQFNIMLLLKYAETPLTQNELSSRLLVDKSNVTGLVNRMAAAGLLRRVQVPDDRRAYHLKLTSAGLKLLNQVEQPYREEIAAIMQVFSCGEMRTLKRLMRRLQKSLEEREEDHG